MFYEKPATNKPSESDLQILSDVITSPNNCKLEHSEAIFVHHEASKKVSCTKSFQFSSS